MAKVSSMYKWKVQKGVHSLCPRCHGSFPRDEYDYDEDLCYYCLYPETTKARPADIGHYEGDAKNTTVERVILDTLERTPIKLSKRDERRKLEFDYSKKRRPLKRNRKA